MITWNSTAQTYLNSRAPILPHWLIWVDAKTFAGAAISVGFWTGDDHQNFTVDAASRLYYGAQGAIEIPALSYDLGTAVSSVDLTLSLSPEGEQAVRGYNIRFAPVEIHCALFRPDTSALLDIQRFFKGSIDGSPIPTPPVGGRSSLPLKLVSSMRAGTMTRAGFKSDVSQRRRSSDAFRQYGDLGAVAADPWGGP
jgi:hypothetical protein